LELYESAALVISPEEGLDMQDDGHAYRVGGALAYLVRRMETFCATQGCDVLMYKPRDRARIPQRIPAMDVLNAQARNYSQHREFVPGGSPRDLGRRCRPTGRSRERR
jgi:hypothetical protein